MPVGQEQLSPWNSPTAVNPVNEALTSAVNMYYKPQQNQAAISLANAQANQANATANFTPATLATSLLSNPALTAAMDPDQRANLVKYASQSLTNGMNRNNIGGNNIGANQPSFLGRIISSVGLGSNNSGNSQNISGNQNNIPIQTQNSPNQDFTINSNPNSNSSPSSTSSIMPDSTIGRVAGSVQIPGSAGGVNAGTVANAQGNAVNTTATAEAGNFANQWKDREDKLADFSKNSNDALIADNNILQTHRKLGVLERGPAFGNLPATTAAAADMDRYASTRSTQLSEGLSAGNITQGQFDAGSKMKVTRTAPYDSVENAMAFDHALQIRNLQKQPFYAQAKNNGLLPAQADALWNRYVQENPFWDAKNEQILPNGLNAAKNYFTSPMLKWAHQPSQLSYSKDQDDYNNDQAAGPNQTWMTDKAGAVHRVHVANVKDATAAGFTRTP